MTWLDVPESNAAETVGALTRAALPETVEGRGGRTGEPKGGPGGAGKGTAEALGATYGSGTIVGGAAKRNGH